ncbi:GTPase IMAP family member 4-like isoform X2 [Hoplias malabaricus]|uniref:GTPase IMAP family member 4-like isoform X2 n=1 Tax=Hoplias malabaricus TaxID=27720 RepID=UPI0034627399
MDQKSQDLTVVVFGNSSAVDFGTENILLGPNKPAVDAADFSLTPTLSNVSGRSVSVVNVLDLQDSEIYLDLDSVNRVISRLLSENEIHAFVFVLQLRMFTDADKVGLEWLQSMFGESVLPFVMILFTYEKEEECDTTIDDLKNNPVLEQLLQRCGDRYKTCSKSMNNQSEMRALLAKIDHIVSENQQHCYTAELYDRAANLRENLQSQPKARSQLREDETGATSSNSISEEQMISDQSGFLQNMKSYVSIFWNTFSSFLAVNRGLDDDEEEEAQHLDEEKTYHLAEKTDQLFKRLHLKINGTHTLKSADILQITSQALECQASSKEHELVQMFLQRLLLVDYRARKIHIKDTSNLSFRLSPQEYSLQRH